MPKRDLLRKIDQGTQSPVPVVAGGWQVTPPDSYGPSLRADGTVTLAANLPVDDNVTIDGVDVSELEGTVDKLQAGLTMPTTGYTVFTRGTHLVSAVTAAGASIVVYDDIFANGDLVTVSDTDGNVEVMRITSAGTWTAGEYSNVHYTYSVTRRIETNPAGVNQGWPAETLVNTLGDRGYIAIDTRPERDNVPKLFVRLWTTDPPDVAADEEIARIGNLGGVLGLSDTSYGAAFGRLTTADQYLLYDYSQRLFELRNADIRMIDEDGVEVFRVWGTTDGAHVPGDSLQGPEAGGHMVWSVAQQRLSIYNGETEVLFFSAADGNRLRDMLWIGDVSGPQSGIGLLDDQAVLVLRNAANVPQFVAETGDQVHVHIGNPKPEMGWFEFAEGIATFDGTLNARNGTITGTLLMSEAGQITDNANYRLDATTLYLNGFGQTVEIEWANALGGAKLFAVGTWASGDANITSGNVVVYGAGINLFIDSQGASTFVYAKEDIALDTTQYGASPGHGNIDLFASGRIILDGATLGFFSTASAAQQTVSGARNNPEAALANLLTALDAYGLIVDSTTAS